MNTEEDQFCHYVGAKLAHNPKYIARIFEEMRSEMARLLNESSDRATDMEIIASTLIHHEPKDKEAFVIEKLAKWNGKTSLDWTHTIADGLPKRAVKGKL